jgi:hypothetical protein
MLTTATSAQDHEQHQQRYHDMAVQVARKAMLRLRTQKNSLSERERAQLVDLFSEMSAATSAAINKMKVFSDSLEETDDSFDADNYVDLMVG